jgi:class 3 adenylate cyclase
MLNALEHNNVTILFADICGYTEMCDIYPTIDNVNMLNRLFTAFDSYLPNYNIEQVQIIGDAYMAISGQEYNKEDPLQSTHMLKFAIDILNEAIYQNIKIRIGISYGPVISAKLGINNKMRSYYGDTVNMASRMESHGYPWCIHVSQMFVDQIIKENAIDYNFVQLGYRLIRGKGRIITYLYCVNDEWKEALSYLKYQESHQNNKERNTTTGDSRDSHKSFEHNNIRFGTNKNNINNIAPTQSSFVHNEKRKSIYISNINIKAVLIIQKYWKIYNMKKLVKLL